MVYLKQNKGFSMVSVLISMTIIFAFLPLISFSIQAIQFESKYEELSVQQFFHILQMEITKAKHVEVIGQQIVLDLSVGDDVATIERFNQVIRRQRNHTGHEIYLRNVQEMQLESEHFGFLIRIVTLEGEEYEKIIRIY